ncbi:MAG: efflux RND transporter periplasmic adaptor subunit [Defluviicoccus sp.]|nr:efflux RND transporter periplasmic adaptor subunit [Defluviicoccus sp.]MDG4591228.1 efflux RND transporter periplasmic adaptor subunit [Defluviicoccus sp.]MDS4010010.1 efflux RND transporter periplasmic adaptor subunit [Defluviicoccus sp.]MDS4073917.1 efflux RND transporter periplasmic adaptor subunit [Defluviicoccus sp.]
MKPLGRAIVVLLALAGIGYAIFFTTSAGRQAPPRPTPLSLPAETRFADTVAGSGLIEANTRNIAIGSFASGIVTAINVVEGQRVTAGAALFSLDPRLAEAELVIAQSAVTTTQARVAAAAADLADQEDQLQRSEKLKTGIVISEDRLMRSRFAVRTARARLEAARAEVETALARVHSAEVTLERLTVRAPVAGLILKLNIRVGEFVSAGPTADPLVLLGNDQPMHVRVQIDENDIWRLKPDAAAEAVVRGQREQRFALKLVRVDPYVLPKRSLTGERSERVDTRVLELIYSFDPGEQTVFIGQQVDVFIEARPIAAR